MKKQLFLTIALLICAVSFAQITVEKSSKKTIDEMLKNIDKSDLSSGILLNRSGNFSDLVNLNLSDSRPINYAYFKQTLLDLYSASDRKKFISNQNLKKKIKNLRESPNNVTLGIINTDFETVNFNNKNQKESGLKLKKDKTFELIQGRKAFTAHHKLVISPLKNGVKGSVIQFNLSDEFWFKYSKNNIEKLIIKFDNGQVNSIIEDGKFVSSQIRHSFSKTGLKTFEFEAILNDQSIVKTKSELYVIVPAFTSRNSQCILTGTIEDDTLNPQDMDLPFQGYDETSPIFGKIDFRTYYRTNNGNTSNTLLKPVIIIDGFDPGDTRRIEDCDCEVDPICAAKYLTNGVFDPSLHTSIFEFNYFKNQSGNQENLIETLRGMGFDVIIVNHPTYISGGKTIDGGADYIERNGLNLTKLIRNVNAKLITNGSNEELVIVGPSMGGQISRYALAYMEKKYAETNQAQWDHNTRLWISVDSPHVGANIPMGVQSFLHQAYSLSAGAQDFVDDQLGSKAARQQLIEQWSPASTPYSIANVDSRTVLQGFSSSRGASFFQQYYNNLFSNGLPNSDGYPQNLRKISLINGSLTGSKKVTPDQISASCCTSVSYEENSEQTTNVRGYKVILGTKNHMASVETYSLSSPNTGLHKISRFKGNDGGLFGTFFDNSVYMQNFNSRGNLDNAPGGWFPAYYEIVKEVRKNNKVTYWQTWKNEEMSSFIPSFSAIGHLSPDQSWKNPLNKNLVCQNLTPFDSYFGEEKNTRHTSFNANSVAWLLSEVNGNPQNPYFPINPNDLVGPKLLCNNQVATYTFNGCSTPSSVNNWQVSGGLQIISSTANSITVRSSLVGGVKGWIKASFSNGASVKKDIWLGKAQLDMITFTNGLGEEDSFCTSHLGNSYSIAPRFSEFFGTTHQVRLRQYPNLNVVYTSPSYSGNMGTLNYTPQPGWYSFEVRINNPCGTSDWIGQEILFMDCSHSGGGGGEGGEGEFFERNSTNKNNTFSTIKIYPIPSDKSLKIESHAKKPNETFEVKIFDSFGRLLYRKQTSQSDLEIDTSKFKNGNYILQIKSSEGVLNRKILVQH